MKGLRRVALFVGMLAASVVILLLAEDAMVYANGGMSVLGLWAGP